MRKYLNQQEGDSSLVGEFDIPYIGTVIAKGRDQLEFSIASQLSEEAGGLQSSKVEGRKGSMRQEMNLGKVGEVCMMSREQVKVILQVFAS